MSLPACVRSSAELLLWEPEEKSPRAPTDFANISWLTFTLKADITLPSGYLVMPESLRVQGDSFFTG